MDDHDYVRLRDVPKLLGIGRATVYEWIAAGKIKRYELHGIPFAKREDLQPRLVKKTDRLAHSFAHSQKPDLAGKFRTKADGKNRGKPKNR